METKRELNKRIGSLIYKSLNSKKRGHLRFILPTIIVLILITVFPTIYGMWLSFQNIPRAGISEIEFVGWSNYISLFKSPIFWNSLKITIYYVSLSVFLSLFFGFLLALLLNSKIYGKRALLGVFILPIIVTPVVSGLVWKFMFSSDMGIINYVLGLIGISQINWLSIPILALIVIVIVELWQWIPFCMLLILAGLQNIPNSTYEAAYIDGTNKFQLFRHIIFPQLIPVTSVVVLFRLMDSFKAFDIIFVITQGGPGRATETLNLLAYYTGFRYFDLCKAAAMGLLILIVVIIASKFILSIFKEK